jgi:transcriptional regulator with XRE-family HTH domain
VPGSVALIINAQSGKEPTDERLREEQTIMTALLREVIGDVLRRARTEQGRTLREVSDTARVSLGYLSEVERGRKEASSELLSAICGALDLPLSRVLSDAGEDMAQAELAALARASAANIDATTKVVIPQVVSLAVA